MVRIWWSCGLLLMCLTAYGDEPKTDGGDDPAATTGLALSDDVRELLNPLFTSIAEADVSRVTVDLTAESAVAGEVVDRQASTYQIASRRPNRFTIYLKEATQRTRIYSDGESMVVAMAPDAYMRLPKVIGSQEAVLSLPIPMGPYPEPILALSMAGVDPAMSLLGGMKSVEVVDRDPYKGVPAVHLRGVQKDAVSWDLWLSQKEKPEPIRLLVDLTAMLKATTQVSVPDNFSYRLRFDFLSWRMDGEIDESLFRFTAPKESVEYESMDAYYQTIAGVVTEHPLLGKAAPAFVAERIDGTKVESKDLEGKVLILDFWATWCKPCAAAIPVLTEVAGEFSEEDVMLFGVNTGEDSALVKGFLEEQDWDLDVLLDPDEKVTNAFKADAIPQTVLIGKSGAIESVHIGFMGADELRKRLTDELQVLSIGGKIATATSESDQTAEGSQPDAAEEAANTDAPNKNDE